MDEQNQNSNCKNELYPENCEDKEKESFKEPENYAISRYLFVSISQNMSSALLAFKVLSSNVKKKFRSYLFSLLLDICIFWPKIKPNSPH